MTDKNDAMYGIRRICGGAFSDHRGTVSFVNDCSLSDVKRFYTITQTQENPVRAWMGHFHERKWFVPVSGKTTLVLRRLRQTDSGPVMDPECVVFHLDASAPEAIAVPAGYCSGFRSDTPDAKVLVFSDKTLDEAADDMVRFDKNDGFDWSTRKGVE